MIKVQSLDREVPGWSPVSAHALCRAVTRRICRMSGYAALTRPTSGPSYECRWVCFLEEISLERDARVCTFSVFGLPVNRCADALNARGDDECLGWPSCMRLRRRDRRAEPASRRVKLGAPRVYRSRRHSAGSIRLVRYPAASAASKATRRVAAAAPARCSGSSRQTYPWPARFWPRLRLKAAAPAR